METYRCWCELCGFSKEAENLEGVVNITDQHRINRGRSHFIEFKQVEEKQLSYGYNYTGINP